VTKVFFNDASIQKEIGRERVRFLMGHDDPLHIEILGHK